jgi:hypothetical protein
MTLAEAGEIFAYWAENPPVHLMVQAIARMLGWKPPEKTSLSFADVTAMGPPGITIAAHGGLGMPSPVLDIDALRRRNHARLANNRNRR